MCTSIVSSGVLEKITCASVMYRRPAAPVVSSAVLLSVVGGGSDFGFNW